MRQAITHIHVVPALILLLLAGGLAAGVARASSIQAASSHHGIEEIRFALAPVKVQNAPQGYLIGKGEAEIQANGTSVSIKVELEDANPLTKYNITLTIDAADKTIGTITTNGDGEGELETNLSLSVGSRLLSISVFDVSTFHSPVLVSVGEPVQQTIEIVANSIKSGEEDDGDNNNQNVQNNNGEHDEREESD